MLKPDAFRLLAGDAELTEYLFNTKNNHHFFCSTACWQALLVSIGFLDLRHHPMNLKGELDIQKMRAFYQKFRA